MDDSTLRLFLGILAVSSGWLAYQLWTEPPARRWWLRHLPLVLFLLGMALGVLPVVR